MQGTFRGSYLALNDDIINSRIRGIAGVVSYNTLVFSLSVNSGVGRVFTSPPNDQQLAFPTGSFAVAEGVGMGPDTPGRTFNIVLPAGRAIVCPSGRNVTLRVVGRRLPVFGLPALLVFAIEPDRAGRSVFTIDLWVPAFHTIFA